VAAPLAPHHQPHLGDESLAEHHRLGIIGSDSPSRRDRAIIHPMPPFDLTDEGRAILAELLRETIERDHFPCDAFGSSLISIRRSTFSALTDTV
jgi:hypothetical protein